MAGLYVERDLKLDGMTDRLIVREAMAMLGDKVTARRLLMLGAPGSGRAADAALNGRLRRAEHETTAHHQREAATLEPALRRFTRLVARRWGALVHDGLWFSPRKHALDAYTMAEQHETNPRSVWGYVQGLTRLSQRTPWQDGRFALDRVGVRVHREGLVPAVAQPARELERAVMELRRSGFSEAEIRARENQLRQNSTAGTATALKEHFILERIAEEEKVDLITMASHGRKGIKHLLLGSVAVLALGLSIDTVGSRFGGVE